MTSDSKFKTIETNAVHAGEHSEQFAGAVTAPIFQSATYIYGGESNYNSIKYVRLNNSPNHEMTNEKLASLEQTESAMVTASGMAAITTTLLAVFNEPGGHLLAQNCLYGGTHHFLSHDWASFGHKVNFVNMDRPSEWAEHLHPATKAFYVETITNPLLEVADLEKVVKFCRENNLVSIIDNTLASPYNFTPHSIGFDLVVHSATKYLNGHSDVVAGGIAGTKKWLNIITRKLNHLGGCLDPHAIFLLNRGMKTLALRVREQNLNAMNLARFLEKHSKVKRVFYPGLETHPHHQRAKKLFRGFGGMVSFEFNGTPAEADRFLSKLRIPKVAPSLGGVESLITRPSTTSHSGVSADERKRMGVMDQLIRVSVGIEDSDEQIADFEQAFRA